MLKTRSTTKYWISTGGISSKCEDMRVVSSDDGQGVGLVRQLGGDLHCTVEHHHLSQG